MATIRKNGGKWISQLDRLSIYFRDRFSCVYCGSHDDLTLDHITCHSHGGSDKHNNLVTCCRSCNSKRQDQKIESFATLTQYCTILHLITLDILPYTNQAEKSIKKHGTYTEAKKQEISKL